MVLVALAGRLPVDGGADRKAAGRAALEVAIFVGDAQGAQHHAVKLFRGFEVAETEHCFCLREMPGVGRIVNDGICRIGAIYAAANRTASIIAAGVASL